MKIDHYHLSSPLKGVSKQYTLCLGSSEKNIYAVGVYLQRPTWIKNDAAWGKLVKSIQIVDLPAFDHEELARQ
jgi:hypothetical protein